mgnify:CR=1 FL=1
MDSTKDSITVVKRKKVNNFKSPPNKIIIKNQWMKPSDSLKMLDRNSDMKSFRGDHNIRTKNLSPSIDLDGANGGSFFLR